MTWIANKGKECAEDSAFFQTENYAKLLNILTNFRNLKSMAEEVKIEDCLRTQA